MVNINRICYLIVLFIISYNTYSITPFRVNNIRVDGVQRISAATVLRYIPLTIGQVIDDTKLHSTIQMLYNTNFFKDVRLERQGNILIIDVVERPVISNLTITGSKAFEHDLLITSFKKNEIANGLVFVPSVFKQAILALETEYYNRGYYLSVINYRVSTLERNRVDINITIQENNPAKVSNIQFVGNAVFNAKKLGKQIVLNTGNWLSWWYKDNQYSSDKLAQDLQTIKQYYLDQGYIDFKINEVQVQLTPDKKHVFITINLIEGLQYKLHSIALNGNIRNVSFNELRKVIAIKSGDIFNQTKINNTIDKLKDILGHYGYAYATVTSIPEINKVNKSINLSLFIDTNKKIYVRNIIITGNKKTRDTVIRRELRQQEDALYDASGIKRSKDRLNLLGYFKSTSITPVPVMGTNQVDLKVNVEETNTGSLNFGVGFAQGQGLLLNGSISQINLFGSGKSASLNASTSLLNQNIGLSFTDPYFASNGISLGYDIYDNSFSPNLVNISPYSTQTLGARLRTGVPVSEFDTINFSLGFEYNQIFLSNANVPLRFVSFINIFGNAVNAVPVSVGWVRNTTDNTLWPTQGALFNEVLDVTAPTIGAQYYRFTSQNTFFTPLWSQDYVWRTSAILGTINPYNASQVPFYQNYFLGGINSLRGYYIGTVGPKDTDGSSYGGTNEVVWSNDLLVPMPGVKEAHTVRLSVFYDIGALWGGNNFNLTPQQSIRASYGVGVTWISPLGPIKLAYALPLFNQPNDTLQPFQFLLGTSF